VANKSFLARGIERNEESQVIQKITDPRVDAFGYRNFKIGGNDNKCQAECRSWRSMIAESLGTTSGFVHYYFDN